jgi:hypothetical protein
MPESEKYNKGPGLFRYGNTYQELQKRVKLMFELYGIRIAGECDGSTTGS